MLEGMPLPLADPDTQPFWDGCQQGLFLLPQCASCGQRRWPPGPCCPACQAQQTDWIPASGRGRLYSWVVAVHPVAEVLVEQVPYVVGLIELEEGIRVVGNVTGCDPSQVEAGMPLELYFEHVQDMQLPNFRKPR